MNYLIAIGYEPDTGLTYYAMATALCLIFIYGFFSGYGFPSFGFKKKENHEGVAMEEVEQLEDWDTICQTAIEQAKMGDHRARDWVVKQMCSDGASTNMNTSSSETSPIENNQGRTEAEEIEKTSPKII